nr:MAG TPA: hypothetical protein [Caudoviricetes sp.]DAX72731.1 MAG TPA: hypothetical protein [Caudoviricetes sp.]
MQQVRVFEKTCLLLAKHYQCSPSWLLSQPIYNLPRYINYINSGVQQSDH